MPIPPPRRRVITLKEVMDALKLPADTILVSTHLAVGRGDPLLIVDVPVDRMEALCAYARELGMQGHPTTSDALGPGYTFYCRSSATRPDSPDEGGPS